MKSKILLVMIFILSIVLTACGGTKKVSNQSEINLDNVQRIVSSMAQREVEITGEADKKNLIFLLKSLSNPVDAYFQAQSKLILSKDDKKMEINISDIYIKIDNKVYKNPSVSKQISSICENYLYNINNYISLLNSKTDIELSANDLGEKVSLSQDAKNELISLLKKPSRHQSQDEPFFIPPDYPYYQIVSMDNTLSPLTIYKSSTITVDSKQREVYFIDSLLYEFCLKYLPLSNVKLTGLKELYLSDTLKLKSSDDGNANKSKMLPIIRVLNEANLSSDKTVISKDKKDLLFYQGKTIRKVTVYKDGFLFANSYYRYENLNEIVVNTLNAN